MAEPAFQKFLWDTVGAVNRGDPPRVACSGHLATAALVRSSLARTAAERSVLEALEEQVFNLPKLQLPAPRGASEPPALTLQTHSTLAEQFGAFRMRLVRRGRMGDDVLRWLIDDAVTPVDPLHDRVRAVCKRAGIASLLEKPVAVGSGEPRSIQPVDGEWLDRFAADAIDGRRRDLRKHAALLAVSAQKGDHYLLVGHPGVGKSIFVRHLLREVCTSWSNQHDLQGFRFVFVDRADFLGSEADLRSRLEALHAYLDGHPEVLPVFDGFELFLNRSLPLHAVFLEYFGAVLHGGGRTFLLVCRSADASSAECLRGIHPQPLAGLSPKSALPVVERKLVEALRLNELDLVEDIAAPDLGRRLIELAAQRYPGRALPEVALHLVQSGINRALGRRRLEEPPLGKLALRDVEEHVAEEQGLSIEILGKEPREFYAGVAEQLRGDVVGQDHAIDRICQALTLCAISERTQRYPRGRFLFVGPPGVGKTHLGRCLSQRLGYGREAFFRYNMADFGNEGDRWRFIGSAPGYEGHGDTRTIFDDVRERPSCVILLDEIDRAHAAIQDILLSILEGEGKDASNRQVYFSQAIFLMTTNQGQEIVEERFYVEPEATRDTPEGRAALARALGDSELRALIRSGAVDEAERAMQRYVEDELRRFRDGIGADLSEDAPAGSRLGDVDAYLQLRGLQDRMARTVRQTAFDRAFLDRIDFVVPFFPLGPLSIRRIIDMKLVVAGWADCPADVRQQIYTEAGSSGRVDGLILRHRQRALWPDTP